MENLRTFFKLFFITLVVSACGNQIPFFGEDSDSNSAESETPIKPADTVQAPTPIKTSPPALPDDLENLTTCRALGGSSPITNTKDVVDLINGLIVARASPVTLPCLMAALPRPLQISVVDSFVSAQPSDGPTNPRVFIRFGTLYLSVVSGGIGASLLEFSEFLSAPDSVKGELKFPIESTIDAAAPFTRIAIDLGDGRNATGCSNCHANERSANLATFPASAFISRAIRPKESQILALSVLSRLEAECYAGGAFRCGLIKSLFVGERPVSFLI